MCHHSGASFKRGFYSHGYDTAQHPNFGPWAKHFGAWQSQNAPSIPVNLLEKKDWYELSVYAPGLNKDAFQVNVADDILTIRFQHSEQEPTTSQWLHREYQRTPFERSFQLNGKVDTTSISARYTDGVLELTLPKTTGSIGHDITIA
jgi:HSP20 family molecular chaperone IbpA